MVLSFWNMKESFLNLYCNRCFLNFSFMVLNLISSYLGAKLSEDYGLNKAKKWERVCDVDFPCKGIKIKEVETAIF